MLLQIITDLILAGNTKQAKKEVYADEEYAKICGKPRQLNDLQKRDLLQAIIEAELMKPYIPMRT